MCGSLSRARTIDVLSTWPFVDAYVRRQAVLPPTENIAPARADTFRSIYFAALLLKSGPMTQDDMLQGSLGAVRLRPHRRTVVLALWTARMTWCITWPTFMMAPLLQSVCVVLM